MSLAFDQLFEVPPGTSGAGPWAMFLAGVSGAVQVPFGVFQGSLVAAQRFGQTSLVAGVSSLLRIVFIVVLFQLTDPNLAWVAAVSLLLAIVPGIIALAVVAGARYLSPRK